MIVEETNVAGALLLKPKVFGDARGFFLEMWNRGAYSDIGIDADFVQDNHSRSAQYVLRGLHYQTGESAQGKLVWVSSGVVFDAFVDLRKDSPTFGKWDARFLTADTHERVWVPPGCAHGFLVISPTADFHYKCTNYYAPAAECVLRWDDPELGIKWPLPDGIQPVLSGRDQRGDGLVNAKYYETSTFPNHQQK